MRHRARLYTSALLLQAVALVLVQGDASPSNTNISSSNNTSTQQHQVINAPTTTTIADVTNASSKQQSQKYQVKSNCSQPCTNSEFASILSKLSRNVDILREFQRNEAGGRQQQQQQKQQQQQQQHQAASNLQAIRPECIKQLIQMIKNLASGELEMKTLLEFASSTSKINLRSDLSYLRASHAHNGANKQDGRGQAAGGDGTSGVQANQSADCPPTDAQAAPGQHQLAAPEYLLGDEPSGSAPDGGDPKAHFLPKLVASIDQMLDTVERFTVTREWGALMRVFKGLESILNMFSSSLPATGGNRGKSQLAAAVKLPTVVTGPGGVGAGSNASTKAPANGTQAQDGHALLLAELERELPRQVQTLTSSLNQLFPWHVWPWNNMDLYSTIDTFLNHGIFAFSKTTAGPERRIDYLPQMLESLFGWLKQDSFPKKCNDWSRIICDLKLFYDRLALAERDASQADESGSQRQEQDRRELMSNNKNKLTQELVCIMFSSLSMQQFGAKDIDFGTFDNDPSGDQSAGGGGVKVVGGNAQQLLFWDRQIRKGLKLYKLSREALNDEQWAALNGQLNGLWSQMKISDRVIMVGRIIQLLTNCHMPREILESALWKDIYKYKNALNQIGDIVIEELNRSSENGQFTLKQLAIGSKHLEEILKRFVKLLPRLIESLSSTLTDQLPELVGKFFEEKIAFFKGPCKGHSFGELVPSLAKYRDEIVELELAVCKQLSTKPSITMMQINNLTNEILAMAFNFTNLGGANLQSLPRLWSSNVEQAAGAGTGAVAANRQGGGGGSGGPAPRPQEQLDTHGPDEGAATENGTSIIDELAANPRLAQIVAILQSSTLDPPEVHAELPELDWVEAGTSVALLYEAIQKLMSYEGLFVVFPEVGDFQDEMRVALEASKGMFTKFSKKDPVQLVAYSLDTLMPVALRTFQSLDSFHSECQSTFRDILGETDFASTPPVSSPPGAAPLQPVIPRESRQWQCAVSATNFASFALNNLMRTFNDMLRNILGQMSRQRDMFKFNSKQQQEQQQLMATANTTTTTTTTASSNMTAGANSTCVLFDGSVTTLMDNLPHLVDLALESILISSTSPGHQRATLKETLCSFESCLDPFAEQQLKLREAVCHLLHESSLATCSDALRLDQWTSTMRELNVTWFEVGAVSVEPSFRGILLGVQEFLELFGKVKPSSMSDGLIARVLNFHSYWTGLMNKAVSSFEKYKERRFQVALQILMPIIYDENLPPSKQPQGASDHNQTKHALKTSILSARSLLVYLNKPEAPQPSQQQQQQSASNSTDESGSILASKSISSSNLQPASSDADLVPVPAARNQELIESHLRALFDWADRYSIVMGETLLRTLASNATKLENLIRGSGSNGTSGAGPTMNETWTRLCSAPIDTYLEFDVIVDANKASLPSHSRLVEMNKARGFICEFEWTKLERRLFMQSPLTSGPQNALPANALNPNPNSNPVPAPLDQYSTKQLMRVVLTKWGQVMDLVVALTERKSNRLPKFLTINHWQQLQERLPAIAPSQYEPTNFIWVWQAFEQLIGAMDSASAPGAAHQNQSVAAAAAVGGSSESLVRMFEQLNCALDTVKGGMTWENMVNIYQDRQDVLAAHSTLNNGIALASAGANTFLAHKKFQKFLNSFVKPRMGLAAFCDMRDRSKLESVFSLSSGYGGSGSDSGDGDESRGPDELISALESFQEFVCDTNLETLVLNINPISVCYPSSGPAAQPQQQQLQQAGSTNVTTTTTTTTTTSAPSLQRGEFPLAQTIDRFFKLASLAILDAKLVDTTDARPPIFDKGQWHQLRLWWLNQTEAHQGNSGLALTLVRVFQTLDSINSEHVVWRAIFRSVHELSEVSAYLLRAAEMERQASLEMRERGQPTKLALIREAAEQIDSSLKSSSSSSASSSGTNTTNVLRFGPKQQQLASTMANVMFPEVSNFISLRTFKQLRYIKSISDYFATAPGAQELICQNLTAKAGRRRAGGSEKTNSTNASHPDQRDKQEEEEEEDAQQPLFSQKSSKFELIDYKLNTSKRLYSLLCHYHSSQWLTAMNIVLSGRTSSLTKKVNYMTKYLSMFTKNFEHTEHNEHLQSFIHGQQLENIEAVANKTVSYMIALSQPFRTLTLSKISNISWHSIPSLLDSIDHHLCASKYDQQQQQQQSNSSTSNATTQQQRSYQLAVYEPKKPDIEVIICKLPSWNITQVYNYFSENIDLQNMISLATQNNHAAKLFGIQVHQPTTPAANQKQQQQQLPVCITPFKFASKWLKIIQDLIDEALSKSTKDKIRKCLSLSNKNQSAYLQTVRYVTILNSLLSTLDGFTTNNSWPVVRKTWNSISYAILNQSGSTPMGPLQLPQQSTTSPSSSNLPILSNVHN